MKKRVSDTAAVSHALRVRACCYLGTCFLALFLATGNVWAEDSIDKTIDIDISESMSLEDALIAWGLKSGLTVMVNSYDLDHRPAKSIHGTLSARNALSRLLSGSGLSYVENGGRVRIISEHALVRSAQWKPSPESLSPSRPDFTGPVTDVGGSDASENRAGNASDSGLQTILVSAERREENIEKVPISITALSQQTMDDLHITSLADLGTIAPGLFVSPAAGGGGQDYSTVAIRGVVSRDNAPTTQFYIDETPIAIRQMQGAGNSGSPQPLIFDLDHVEVLRGPQGTLFGASSMGGAIRFITPQPNLELSTEKLKADISYTDGGRPNYELGVVYGSPVVQGSAGFRVSAWFQSLGGFVDQEDPFTGQILRHNANKSKSWVIRPAFTWAPTDSFSITPSVFVQHRHSDNPSEYWLTDLPNPERTGEHASGGFEQPLRDDLRVASLAIKYDLSGAVFQSDTSYLNRDFRANNDFTRYIDVIYGGAPFIPGLESFHSYEDDLSYTHAWQQEFRLSSQNPSARITWVVGAYYRRALQGLSQLIPPDLSPVTEVLFGQTSQEAFPDWPNYVHRGQVLNSYTDFHTLDISEALFGNVTASLAPQLKLDLGLRVERQQVRDQHQVIAGPLNGVSYTDVTLVDQSATPVTPRVSLIYQITDDSMIYAGAAKGYRPGGGNAPTAIGNSLCLPDLQALGLTAVPSTFKSDSLWNYEVGSKNVLFDRKVSVEASAYYIKWKDIQTAVGLPTCTQQFTANRGRAVSRGGDIQFSAMPLPGWTVRALWGYTDAYFPDATYSPHGKLVTVSGDRIRDIRPWQLAINSDYSYDLSRLWSDSRSYLRVDYRRVAEANSRNSQDAGFVPAIEQHRDEGYGTLGIRIGLVHGPLDVSTYVENATNSDPISGRGRIASVYWASAIQPRTYGVTVWLRLQ